MKIIAWFARIAYVMAALASSMSAPPALAAAPAEPVVQVENGSDPTLGVVSLEARELWRIGGADADHIFGVIARAFTDHDGNI